MHSTTHPVNYSPKRREPTITLLRNDGHLEIVGL